MTWTNAFTVGPCTVKVTGGGSDYYSGNLGAGESSPVFSGQSGALEKLQVSVDGSGNVSLLCVAGSAAPFDGYYLRVLPTYALSSAGVQASGIGVFMEEPSQNGLAAYADITDTGHFVALTPNATTPATQGVTPDPAVLSALPSLREIAVYMGAAS